MVLLYCVQLLIATCYTSAFFVNLNQLGDDLEKKYHLQFLKDYFKFPVYVNPHPRCALEDEGCTLDTNCCGGLECKMTVDREGVGTTCQVKVKGKDTDTEGETGDEDEWLQDWEDSLDNDLLEDVYKTRLQELDKKEKRLVDDQYYLIKELEKPLSFEEMRELQHAKEIEDYKRENELKNLRKWAETKKAEEEKRRETEKQLRDLAKERVHKVLQEEERQKKEIFQEILDNNRKKSWF